jgi:hypothetical protein
MNVDISGLTPEDRDEAFRRIAAPGASERDVLAYMARCRSANLRAQLDRLAEEAKEVLAR